jgi:glutamate formiminotransferase/formiminotetrahydrofolate cyclodeaminase
MDAMRLPKKKQEDKEIRAEAIEEATKEATLVPLNVLKRTEHAARLARLSYEKGNKNSLSDAAVAALTARSAAEGAFLNIIINLGGIKDKKFKVDILEEAKKIMEKVVEHTEETVLMTKNAILE